ncbi:LURP-one-related/scramblase family protein [Loigolactobacillus backii]|uniref:Uncharacterized protein n=1 Tax=Loigolactobacillus backii TaxID=375175 RepID=A0A192H4W7_9LACO|nr:hypothetical protein [Loigolactobacillus backii]ANK59952.1 hypothetical protein AYR52_06565 [Loigolactobacillus backii]ANK63288.1 hypothetical protein AYR53_11225 [Loigolactobacillus backii]ANK64887.1 hypothetical protein AYR54_06245 [Loigolactobacillus backii]ANK66666.1 hypothetical protein AYR55_02510 [Loigolactobacillus backii]ANK69707.1 hypothetical protein AYR56_05780 [Loigolactobacillus backii]
MLQLYIKQQLLASKGVPIIVRDQKKKPRFLVTGRFGLRQDSFTLYAMDGHYIAEIKQMSLGLFPKFDLYLGHKKVGAIKKMYGVWHQFQFVNDLNWIIMGDLLRHHYKIYHRTETLLVMDKAFLSDGDYYQLSITHESDAPLCILLSLVLDHWSVRRDKKPQKRRNLNAIYD